MNKEEFLLATEDLGIKITDDQMEKLEKFYWLLSEWNQKMNLTRIIEREEVYLKHFYDSLTICKGVDLNHVETLCDVGSGAGFPGVVLKIVFPNLKITLIEALNKRVIYLNEIIQELELKDIKAIHCRGEDYQGKFDVVTSRAVANIEKLVKYTMHLLNSNGVLIAMKGDISSELTEKTKRRIEQKYKIIKIEKFLLPIENSKRSLVILSNKN